MNPQATRVAAWAGFVLMVIVFSELGARLDDWFVDDVPMLSSATYDDLFFVDEQGRRRGRPNALWKHVRLNNLGMRGADVSSTPRGCPRWMFLGASETFGEPTVKGSEYPARVTQWRTDDCIEVLNTALPGIAPSDLVPRYESTLARYRPDVVFVYPPAHLYLADIPRRSTRAPHNGAAEKTLATTQPQQSVRPTELLSKSRFLERVSQAAEVPPAIQRWRLHRWIDDASQGKPHDWRYRSVPLTRLTLLEGDMTRLVAAIRRSGAEPVLMTHAVRATNPPRRSDHDDLLAMRLYVPRASEAIIAKFEYLAGERVRQVAVRSNVRIVDVAKALNGRRDRFIDLVHFSPAGHAEVARLIHHALLDPS
jgi:hypothetical protein